MNNGGFVKLYGSILTSSVWVEPHHVVRVWITMLALADKNGYVSGSVPGLANVSRASVDETRDALARLAAPDADSRTPDHDGRRIEKVDGGWMVLNHQKYRDLRTTEQVAKAESQQRWREGKRKPIARAIRDRDGGLCGICAEPVGDDAHQDHIVPLTRGGATILQNLQLAHPDCNYGKSNGRSGYPDRHPSMPSTVDRVDDGRREVSASASASGFSSSEGVQGETGDELTEREAAYDFIGAHDFGPFTDSVLGLLKTQRVPSAVIQTLRMHLSGELAHERCDEEQLGLACQQYLASGGSGPDGRFSPQHFAGFVRRVKGRLAGQREQQNIQANEERKRLQEAEDAHRAARLRGAVESFEDTHPKLYTALQEQAEADVTETSPRGRPVMVRARLRELIREHLMAHPNTTTGGDDATN